MRPPARGVRTARNDIDKMPGEAWLFNLKDGGRFRYDADYSEGD
jgi:hypothetical protein